VLGESADGRWIRQQHAGVQNVRAPRLADTDGPRLPLIGRGKQMLGGTLLGGTLLGRSCRGSLPRDGC